jgi:hypothetical protein
VNIQRFKFAVRHAFDFVVEGLMWLGLGFNPGFEWGPEVAAEMRRRQRRTWWTVQLEHLPTLTEEDFDIPLGEYPDLPADIPLSRAEQVEWASLEARLR